MATRDIVLRRGVAFALAVLSVGCGGGAPTSDDNQPTDHRARRIADCAELVDYAAEVSALEADLTRRFGLGGGAGSGGEDAATGLPPPAQDPASLGADRQFSTTNVQEEGVDEADFVKADGDFFYVLSGGRFLVLRAWPAPELAELSRVEVEGDALGLLVRGDTALVVSQLWDPAPLALDPTPKGGPVTVLTVIDVADRTAPKAVRELCYEGAYSAARLVGSRAYLVLTNGPMFAGLFGTVDAPPPAGAAAERRAFAAPVGVTDVFPRYWDRRISGGDLSTRSDAACACDDVYRPAVENGLGVVLLVTLDLDDPGAEPGSTAILGNGGTVYASRDSVYVAAANTGVWTWLPVAEAQATGPRETTVVHKFSLGAEPAYAASGEVRGWVQNAFSLSEHGGALRVATTESPWSAAPSNAVTVLRQDGQDLVVLGSLTGLGKEGDRIQGVRFLGERGFVVTFRRVDPLYALDLSDPAAPKKVGELEVPGFSTYLHPVGDSHLLAVGQTAPDPARPGTSLELSLFDVSDLAHPSLVDRETIGSLSYSEAQFEHKAFTYFAPLRALGIPVTAWSGDPAVDPWNPESVFSGLLLYDVDPAQGDQAFSLRGRIDHASFYRDEAEKFWYYPEGVQRSFFIGVAGADTAVYTVSGRGIKASSYEDPAVELAGVPLPSPDLRWPDFLGGGVATSAEGAPRPLNP